LVTVSLVEKAVETPIGVFEILLSTRRTIQCVSERCKINVKRMHTRSNSLGARSTIGHVNSNTTVVDGQSRESPGPVPVHEDRCLAVVECHVARSELLVAKESSIFTTIKGQISHKSTGAVVHEDTNLRVGGSSIGSHVEDDILERSGLSNLPMNTGPSSKWHCSQVENKVSDLTEEVVLISVPVDSALFIGI
jgi:hypothetical protein